MYTRISKNNLLCLKSVSHCRGDIEKLAKLICNWKLKPKFDDTVESAHFIYEHLPHDVYVFYQKHKKILIVSPRDLVIMGKMIHVSEDEVFLLAKAIDLPSIPPQKNIVRADLPLGAWRLQVKEKGTETQKPLVKLTFISEIDFKISLFIQKNVGPKSGHLT